MMRAVLQLLFIATYLVSGYATNQYWTRYLVHELLHSQRDGENPAYNDACKVRAHVTHFREAKRSVSEGRSGPDRVAVFLPTISTFIFHHSSDSAVHQYTLRISQSRAPPASL